MIIGLQSDLRENDEIVNKLSKEGLKPISKEQGQWLAWRFGAEKYLECSTKTGENIDNVFKDAILKAVAHQQERKNKTLIKNMKELINGNLRIRK